MKLEDIERVLATLGCPLCSTRNFDLRLRCDLGYAECLPTVRCRQCGHEFDAEWLIRSQPQESPADLEIGWSARSAVNDGQDDAHRRDAVRP